MDSFNSCARDIDAFSPTKSHAGIQTLTLTGWDLDVRAPHRQQTQNNSSQQVERLHGGHIQVWMCPPRSPQASTVLISPAARAPSPEKSRTAALQSETCLRCTDWLTDWLTDCWCVFVSMQRAPLSARSEQTGVRRRKSSARKGASQPRILIRGEDEEEERALPPSPAPLSQWL